MIAEGTHPPVQIDLGKDEPGMTLQREYRERGYLVWRDYLSDSKLIKSPVAIDVLPEIEIGQDQIVFVLILPLYRIFMEIKLSSLNALQL